MIELTDIVRAISREITEKVGMRVYGRDVVEGFKRPCAFIDIVDVKTDMLGDSYISNNFYFLITFFGDERTQGFNDLMNMHANIGALFRQPIAINSDFIVVPKNIDFSFNNSDKALACSFDINTYQYVDVDAELPNITDIEINVTNKEGEN